MNFVDRYFELIDAQRALEIAESAVQELHYQPRATAPMRNAAYRTVQTCAGKVNAIRTDIQSQLASEGSHSWPATRS